MGKIVTVSFILCCLVANMWSADRVLETPHGKLMYQLFEPKAQDGGEPTGLLLLLPPGPQTKPMAAEVRSYVNKAALKRGWVIAIPYLDPKERTLFYLGAQKRIPFMLDALQEEFAIDAGRTIVVGVSNGGVSALNFAVAYPFRVQAVVGTPGMFPQGLPLGDLSTLRDMPIYLRVGGKDSPTWNKGFKETVAKLKEVGADLNAEVMKKFGHGLAIDYGKVLQWVEERAFGVRSRIPAGVLEALDSLATFDAETADLLLRERYMSKRERLEHKRTKERTKALKAVDEALDKALADPEINADAELVEHLKALKERAEDS